MTGARTRYLAMAATLAFAAVLSVMVQQGRATPLPLPLETFPSTIGDWQGESLGPFSDDVLRLLQVSNYMNRLYRRREDQVSLYIGYYDRQKAGVSFHSPKNCLPGSGWEVLESRRALLEMPGARSLPVNHYIVQKGSERMYVLYWYEIQGRAVANEYEGKALLVWDALRTGRSDGAMIRLMIPITTGTASPAGTLQEFAQATYPFLKKHLPQ